MTKIVEVCEYCNGDGEVINRNPFENKATKDCSFCNGKGWKEK